VRTFAVLATLLCAIGCKSESGVTTTVLQLPYCTARTPANATGFYPKDALPQGACKDDPKCQIQVERPCACSAVGPVDDYTCTCTNGTWACAIDQQGGACTCGDAAAD
jgi:hypothetical protein